MEERNEFRKLPSHYSLSVIVPAFNEEDNIEPLAHEFKGFLADQRFRAEVIIVDDGSTDSTAEKVLELSEKYEFLKLVRHKQNMGKTAAIESGFAVSRGKRICIFDADLQYDVQDIKRMMDKLDRGYGIVSGIKKGKYQKPFISKIYNKLTSKLFGVEVQDMNSLKVLRRDVMASLFLRKDWHRFMVVLAAEQGFRVAEIPVTLRPRLHGEPKYGGFGRVFIGFTDLIAVWLAERVFRKPMLIFGSIGFVTLATALLLGVALLLLRFIWHWGYPPLQTLLVLLISVGGFSLTLGFLAEAIANLRDRLEYLMSKVIEEDRPKVETARTTQIHKRKDGIQNKPWSEDRDKRDRPRREPERENRPESSSEQRQPERQPQRPPQEQRQPERQPQRPPQEQRQTERQSQRPPQEQRQPEKPPQKPTPEQTAKPLAIASEEKSSAKPDRENKIKSEAKKSDKIEPQKTREKVDKPAEKPERKPRRKKEESQPQKVAVKEPEPAPPENKAVTEPSERISKLEIIPPNAEPSWGKRERKGRSTVGKVADKEAIKRAKEIAQRLGGDAYIGFKEESENTDET
jgi:glycosyltransferase involved in cell wall biosynthesis